jgi:hypothetical protein
MPRRERIDEKKKERLMQENDLLQSLMLRSKSSVRRSSLRDDATGDELLHQENEPVEIQTKHQPEDIVPVNETVPAATPIPEPRTIPLQEERTPAVEQPQERLTTTVTHPEDREPAPRLPQTNRTINVILPEQKRATPLPLSEPEVKRTEPVRRTHNALIVEKDMFQKEEPWPVVKEEYPTSRPAKRNTPKSNPAKVISYTVLMLLGLLVGFGGYYFYAKYGSRTARTGTKRNTEVVTAPMPQAPEESRETATERQPDEDASQPADTRITNETAGKEAEEAPVSNANTTEGSEPDATLGRYKVISKAYFHGEPDENTRRNAFIIHWNNAVLTPVEEKNGFVYVVFTNHLGQTSRGWLLKKDLSKLN